MTMQELPERRPGKIDLNLLPKEYLPKRRSPWVMVLVLVVVVLACLPWPFLIMKADVDSDNRQLQAEKESLELEYNQKMAVASEGGQLQRDIEAANAVWLAILGDYELFQDRLRAWSEIKYDVKQKPRGVLGELTTVSQNEDVISIDGWFSREEYIYEYALMLADTGHFIEDGVDIRQVSKRGEEYQFKIDAQLLPAVSGEGQ